MIMQELEKMNPSSQFAMNATTNSTINSISSVTPMDINLPENHFIFVNVNSTSNGGISSESTTTQESIATQASSTIHNNRLQGQQKPVIDTLTKLYNETCAVLGGAQATGDKKQEIDDNTKNLGALFVLLNSGEISENAFKHLVELCRMLDRRDFGSAFEILASLSKSHGYECNLWMVALKRMLNARVNGASNPSSPKLSPRRVAEQLSRQQQFLQQAALQQKQCLQKSAMPLLDKQAIQRLQEAQIAQLQAGVANQRTPSGQTSNTASQGSFMPQAGGSGSNNVLLRSTPPSSPGQSATAQQVVIPTLAVQDVDTSSVPAQQKPVITTLTRLLNETNEAKKQEIQDNITKMTALFGKINRGEISANAVEKIVELCQALDRGDFATALQIQMLLSASHWGECNFWLGSLKRMTKQNERNQESFFA